MISSNMSPGRDGLTAPRERGRVGDEAGNGFGVREFFILRFELLVAHPHGQDSGRIAIGDGLTKD